MTRNTFKLQIFFQEMSVSLNRKLISVITIKTATKGINMCI